LAGQLRRATGTVISAFEGVPLLRRQSAPHPGVLSGVDGPFQAGVNDLAATTDDSRLFDLVKRRIAVSHREEQLWVLVQTSSAAAPSHQMVLLESRSGVSVV